MADEKKEWVDFKLVKEKINIEMVLDHYKISLQKTGDELRGACPIHKGVGKQFSVNVKKNAFQCFYSGCKAKGNVLDFVAVMEDCDLRRAALKLASWFQIGEQQWAGIYCLTTPVENKRGRGEETETVFTVGELSALIAALLEADIKALTEQLAQKQQLLDAFKAHTE